MATGMANVRQSIVLSVEVDQMSARPTDGFKCRIKTICMSSDGESLLFQEVADEIMRSVLVICEFWMGPNLITVSVHSSILCHQYMKYLPVELPQR